LNIVNKNFNTKENYLNDETLKSAFCDKKNKIYKNIIYHSDYRDFPVCISYANLEGFNTCSYDTTCLTFCYLVSFDEKIPSLDTGKIIFNDKELEIEVKDTIKKFKLQGPISHYGLTHYNFSKRFKACISNQE